MSLVINIDDLEVQLFEHDTCIIDSYKVRTVPEMMEYVDEIRLHPEVINNEKLAIHKRTKFSMVNEWQVHNLLYDFHIFRSRTKDVDLEVRPNWFVGLMYDIAYFIGSFFYL